MSITALGIKLTKTQIEALRTLSAEINKMYAAGRPGALMAQVIPRHGQMYVISLNAEQSSKLAQLLTAFQEEEGKQHA